MEPLYIDSSPGDIFGIYHSPDKNIDCKGVILFIPPFAEELNRSRHMINYQARAFLEQGYGVFILDLFGTGDSAGTFGQATIAIWEQNILDAINWLKEKSKSPIILWAMRSGALLTTHLLQDNPYITNKIILWSPVTNGKKFISQYMRIKLAADVTQNTGSNKLSLNDLWEQLKSGSSLEIAGYEISPELAHGMADLAMNKVSLPQSLAVKWIEISLSDPPTLSPGSQRIIADWQNNKIDVTAIPVNDISFWTLQEPEWAKHYVQNTLSLLD